MTEPTVLIVDDSRFIRNILESELSDNGFNTETASNGVEAIDAIKTVNPDVVTMDVEMPKMNGIEAVERIMSDTPVPIIMLSAHTADNADTTLKALDKGAIDFITKPGGREVTRNLSDIIDELVETIRAVIGADVDTDHAPQQKSLDDLDSPTEPLTPTQTGESPVIVLGSSTGGPRLIESILRDLPVGGHARVLVVQHMPKNFVTRFAERLNTISPYDVSEATDDQIVAPGEVVIAPGDKHLRVKRDTGTELVVGTDDTDPRASFTPSIDVTMLDAGENIRSPCVGAALTGMGDDGQKGIQMIKQAGGRTIAQDEESSAVFGIPKRAIETDCIDTVLSADEVVPGIVSLLNPE